jgi:hypothetical protein
MSTSATSSSSASSSQSTQTAVWFQNPQNPNDFCVEPALSEFGTPISIPRQQQWVTAPDGISPDSLLHRVTLDSYDEDALTGLFSTTSKTSETAFPIIAVGATSTTSSSSTSTGVSFQTVSFGTIPAYHQPSEKKGD